MELNLDFEVTESKNGLNYWFYEENKRDKYHPHQIKITIKDGFVVDYTCTCTHGTIQLSMKSHKTCTHIRKNLNLLKGRGLINED